MGASAHLVLNTPTPRTAEIEGPTGAAWAHGRRYDVRIGHDEGPRSSFTRTYGRRLFDFLESPN
jgi:hypothetical protein